jgi:hypothetical protein
VGVGARRVVCRPHGAHDRAGARECALGHRGAKFDHYARLPSLTEYVLVAQDQMRVEHFTRQGDGWLLTEVDAPDDILRLPVLDAALPLVAIYEHVEFPAPAGPNPPAPFPRREGGDG